MTPCFPASRYVTFLRITTGCLALGVAGCDSGSPTATPPAVASVTITPAGPHELEFGSTVTLNAVAADAGGNTVSGRSTTWSSSSNEVASVSTAGVVTAMATEGTATITAAVEGKSATTTITVRQPRVASITLSPASARLPVGESHTLLATLRDAQGRTLSGRAIVWSSNDESIASVSDGMVTAHSSGTATIVATSGDVNATAAVDVITFPIPVSGAFVAPLVAFDEAMIMFMRDRNIGAGSLAIMRNGEVVLHRGYGWTDVARTVPLPVNATFRLASVTKPMTAAAIRRLISEGKLSMETRVFPLLELTPLPAGSIADSRIGDITVAHLLAHQGGWEPAGSIPPSRTISQDLNLSGPPTPTQVAQWMMGRPLDFTPGERSTYSNFGYSLLGLIVEKVDGRSYTEYVRQVILGGTRDDLFSARSRPADRDPREPWYSDPFHTCSTFVINTCQQVAFADGGYYFEGFHSFGGLVGSAPAVLQFMRDYRLDGIPRPHGDPGYDGWFFGSINGTYTLARQRTDGTAYVVLFNQRYDASGLPYDAIRTVMDGVVSQTQVWP